ncbi:putative bifunctional diguanylate cyclase/phosphodiesterase [Azotobacter salinestris]|uniref:putative bifunctional diguanylate cyclase/phosphodiesterase n=1 Tax=Azotobacter salinestris TaxID=69964 RepID=UPI0032DE80D6
MKQQSSSSSQPSAEQLELLGALEHAMAIAEFAPDGRILRANARYRQVFGYTEESIGRHRHQQLCAPDPANRPDFDSLWAGLEQGCSASGRYPYASADGRRLWLEATYIPILDDDRNLKRIVQIASDVSVQAERDEAERERCRLLTLEREESHNRIRQLAFYDTLTGLPNRSLLLIQADQAIARARRNRTALNVLFFDLDRFKQVNDTLGHPAGDAMLRIVAQRLRSELRAADIVGRLAGDEFVVVLTDCDPRQTTETIRRIQKQLSAPCQIAGATLTPSASIGISQFPDNGEDMETLLHYADLAMYQAKSNGRGQFSFFSEEMNRQAQERRILEAALREALQHQQLQLHYQPQIDLKSGRLCGVEALARWTHPQLGSIPPSRFIPLAAECGLAGELDRWALEEACRQLAAWRSAGLEVAAVSVNLSPNSFHNIELPRQIAETLQRHGLQPTDLNLEITQEVVRSGNPNTLKTLHAVQAMDIGLTIDDFGTGYSCLGYLRHLPIRALKLDRSFVRDLEHDEITRALTEAAMRIGDSLRIAVFAEGVENEEQRRLLTSRGYQVAQGFLLSRPLSADQLSDWLEARWPTR